MKEFSDKSNCKYTKSFSIFCHETAKKCFMCDDKKTTQGNNLCRFIVFARCRGLTLPHRVNRWNGW